MQFDSGMLRSQVQARFGPARDESGLAIPSADLSKLTTVCTLQSHRFYINVHL